MVEDVFVVGLDTANRQLLEGLPDADEVRFHAALEHDELRGVERFPFDELLTRARRRLDAAARVDGVCTILDFPATELVPLLARDAGVPGPRLEAVLRCDHKYWSRLVQREVAPESVPRFELLDPFDADSIDAVGLAYPFWVKPLNAFRSQLGFRVTSPDDLQRAVTALRHDLPKLSGPLQEALAHAAVPDEIRALPEHAVLAEELLSGSLCTVEGFVQGDRARAYAVVDSVREPGSSVFARYQYPSRLPDEVQDRARELAERVVTATGLDDSPFNVELFVDDRDRLAILEINARLSQSHAPLFELVDGTTHLKVMLDIARGRPAVPPRGGGEHAVAAKFFVRAFTDAVIEQTPDEDVLATLERRLPGARVKLLVDPGTHLAELQDQDAYSYELAEVYLGADDEERLLAHWEEAQRLLGFALHR